MKLLVNCDQVFDVLTRGPFPTGDASDEAVEQHLRACHDCRRLAEALRPAVELMHEAVASDQALRLPEYQGSLPAPACDDHPLVSPREMARRLRQLDAQPRPVPPPGFDYAQLINGMRLIAASILVVALGTLAWGLLMSARHPGNFAGPVFRPAPVFSDQAAASQPDEQGLHTLALLRLRPVCFRPGERVLVAAKAGTPLIEALESGELLACCTHCHAQGSSTAAIQIASSSRFTQTCSACHRG
jgi:hypothetical protein